MNPKGRVVDLPAWIYFWSLVAFLTVEWLSWQFGSGIDLYRRVFESESGVVEVLTWLLLVASEIAILLSARRLWIMGQQLSAVLMVPAFLFVLFFLGEEVNWGQFLIPFKTPDVILARSPSDQMAIHKIEGFSANKLRWFVIGGMWIGAVGMPLLSRVVPALYRPGSFPLAWLVPTGVLVPVAFACTALYAIHRYFVRVGIKLEDAWGIELVETVELLVAVFAFLYSASLLWRLRQWKTAMGGDVVIGP